VRVTNLASYFDGIISSHDYDVAKEKQEFWQQLEDEFFGVHFRAGLADSYLKRYKKQPDVKQIAKGLLTHCLKHIHNQSENNDRHITEPERLYRSSLGR
jgi:hypothetical protein